ncbi:MAG TPA: ATP-binding protein [Thermoanaerobaculia bacterium]|nr:ATP-binding protein [Thermoanaerobaculia bacterium]
MGLPVALLLLLVLSSFTLLTYRNGVRLLRAERQEEAMGAARAAAARLAAGSLPRDEELRTLHPAALRLVVADARGEPVDVVGEPLDGAFAAPLGGSLPADATAAGPGGAAGAVIAAYAPLAAGGGRWLRLDLAQPLLAGQQRALALLTWTVLGASVAVLLWLALFLRQLLRPYETLLRRARELGGGEAEDEAAFLLATVERALSARPDDAPRGERHEERVARERSEELVVLERTLASSLESGLLLLDREGRVLALNPAGAALLGPPPPPRTPLADFLAPHGELLALLAPVVAAGEGLQRQECDVIAGDELHRIGLTMTPLRRHGGDLLGFLLLFADLTKSEREGQQARLAESLAHLGELSAGVAHELRNGLATLGGYLTLLEREVAKPPAEQSGAHSGEYLAELRGETQRLQRVVTDFLGFTHPGAARLVEVDLPALVRHAAADPALEGAALLVAGDDASPPAVLAGDPQLLERALTNLLRNAVEAQERAGAAAPVAVETGWREESYEIRIHDRGPGISPEMRRRLFQPFASDRPGGVGLGLALAHRIVALHGGTLALEPRADGGITARVAFPRALFERAAPSPDR